MNGFSLQSTTTPRKANKGIESAPGGPIEAEKICLVVEKICMVESDRGK
ncbi:unnamed protein product [Prunus brigantina]